MTAKRIVILVGLLLGLCIVLSVVGWGALYLARPRDQAGPAVIIKEPSNKAQVNTYEMTLVRGLATDAIGVVGVELWVDGELEASARSQLEKGSSPFPVVEAWQPETPGQHTLTVRAYNTEGRSSHVSVRVEALDVPRPVPTPVPHQVQEGETLQTIAEGYGVSGEDIVEQNPGLEEPLQAGHSIVVPPPSAEEEDPAGFEGASPEEIPEGELPDGSPSELYPEDGPPDPIDSIELSPWLAIISRMPFRRIVPPEPMEAALEVEAAFLEVDRTYDGVYCYVSLAGSDTERLPAEGDLASLGERRWGIEAQMGPENRRMVSIANEEGGLEVWVNCLGYTGSEEGGDVSDLGTLMASHFADEWDGRLIEQSVTGPDGWFRVGYRIWRAGAEPEEGAYPAAWLAPPANLREGSLLDGLGMHYGFFFDYPTGLEELVDGFLIYRNGAQLPDPVRPRYSSRAADPEYTTWFAEIGRSDFYPSCPSRYEFYMVAYNEDGDSGYFESDASNSVFTEGDPVPCYRSRLVRVTFERLHARCITVDDGYHGLCHIYPVYDEDGNSIGCETECDPNSTWGTPHGGISINGERVADMWGSMQSATTYELPSVWLHLDPGEALRDLSLGPLDDLTIAMDLWDADIWTSDDGFCRGEYTINHYELYEIYNVTRERGRTYEVTFDGGGGTCVLTFRVLVMWEGED